MIGLFVSIVAVTVASTARVDVAQLSRTEVEQILVGFRPGVDWKLKEAGISRLAATGETYVPLFIECLRWEPPQWLQERLQQFQERSNRILLRSDGSSLGVPSCAEAVLIRIGASAVPRLIDALQTDPETTSAAARILGKIGDKRAVSPLIGVLTNEHQNFHCRSMAAVALQSLDAYEAIPPLIESLRGQADDPYNTDKLADTVANVLAELTGQSFGFTFVVGRVDKPGNIAPRYTIRGTHEERESTITRWKQWWEQDSMFRGQIARDLAQYAEYLKGGDQSRIRTMRSEGYLRRAVGVGGQPIVCDSPRAEWFDAIEGKKPSLPGCESYQISILSCRLEGEQAVVKSCDKALVVDDAKATFVVIVERVLEKQGGSWLVKEENLLTWERPKYGG
jgi:hypothetical protein